MARNKRLTRTGLSPSLPSTLRTVKLKELAEKRAKKLYILRKFIENMTHGGPIEHELYRPKLSIEEFAAKIDLKPGTWSRLERAESCLSIEAAIWIAIKVLEVFRVFVTADWLLGENNNDDLPRIISKEAFDIYEYFKDVYRVADLSKLIKREEMMQISETYKSLEIGNFAENLADFLRIVKKIEDKLLNDAEKAHFKQIMLNYKKDLLLEREDISFIKSVCRRLIISSEISKEEKSTRMVLLGYFMSDLFIKMSSDAVVTYVRDNKMSPVFLKGELVGGNIIPIYNLKNYCKKECIIELKNSIKIVRILHIISSNVIITTTFDKEHTPEMFNLEDINFIALISFRFKNLEIENFISAANHDLGIMNFDQIEGLGF